MSAQVRRFRIEDMDCPTCAGKIETAVTRLSGVTEVKVNPATRLLTVRSNDGSPVLIAVSKLGYAIAEMDTPDQTTLSFKISGMDCATCAAKIETAVSGLPGACEVSVNAATQVLRVRVPSEGAEARVVAILRKLGYDATPLTDARPARLQPPTVQSRLEGFLASGKGRLLVIFAILGILGSCLWVTDLAPEQVAFLPLALAGLFYFGRRAWAGALAGTPFSIETLMSLATVGAIVIGATSEAALVNVLFLIGELLEGYAARRSLDGIRALGTLIPNSALVIDGDRLTTVPIDELQVSQVVLVRPGDRIPVDGMIVDGQSDIDEAAVTGESVPVSKTVGATVLAGSVNTNGVLKIEVTRPGHDNTINRIIRMVEEAQASKAPTARLIERFSFYYTPAAMAAAALTILLPPMLFNSDVSTWIYRGLGLLLVACPCALVLSTPAAIASALAAGARRGLLIKGGAALEALGTAKTVAFDKTGTLTMGKPVVTDVLPIGTDDARLLSFAAAVEKDSNHPIARAIIDRAREDKISIPLAREQRAIAGKAVEGLVDGVLVSVASPRHAADLSLDRTQTARIAALEADGKTVVVVLLDGEPLGLLAVRDEPRPDAKAAISQVRLLGVDTILLSGDNQRTADAVGHALGIDVRAELLPDDKLREISRLRGFGPVVMVGDGINDAPALAAADVGIAMGGGTDVALETADAALLHERVGGVADMIGLSQATRANIAQNVAIALGLKAIFIVTTLTGFTGLWLAILADTGATVLVTLNALRLLTYAGFKSAEAQS